MQTSEQDREAILSLNEGMHAAELRGADGIAFFRDLLDQGLRFRRASGAIATRDEFLIDLGNPDNARDIIEPIGPIACHVYERTAVTTVLLRVKGHNGAYSIDGLFRNIRVFWRADLGSPWRLHVWFNDSVPAADPPA